VAGDDVSILVGKVVDEADIAADNALPDLAAEDTEWFPVLATDNFAIDVVDILAIKRTAIDVSDWIAWRFS